MAAALPYCDCIPINKLNGRKIPKFSCDFLGAMFKTEQKNDCCVHCGYFVVWSTAAISDDKKIYKKALSLRSKPAEHVEHGVPSFFEREWK